MKVSKIASRYSLGVFWF